LGRSLGPVEIIDDVEQGSDAWFNLRLGIPTASVFGTIMADGRDGQPSKTRAQLMRVLAGEQLTGIPGEGKIVTAAMERGKEMEPEAVEHYVNRHFDVEAREVGFVRRKLPSGRFVGCSPDRLIGDRKALEVKTMRPDLLIERLEKGAGMPAEHRAQVQGTIWVADLEEVDLVLFYRGFPISPKFTCVRDEAYIRELSRAVEVFEYETRMLVEKIKRMA
jgi:hypothetical protein